MFTLQSSAAILKRSCSLGTNDVVICALPRIIHAVSSCSGLGQPSEHWQRQEGTQDRLKSYTILSICCPSIWSVSRVLFEILHQYHGESSSLAEPASWKLAMLTGSEYLEGEARSGALKSRRHASRMYRMQGRAWPPGSKLLHRSANTTALSIRVFSSVSTTTSKEVPRLLALIHSAP